MRNFKNTNSKITLLVSIVALILLSSSFSFAHSQADVSWISKSNEYAFKLLNVMAKYNAESTASLGVEGYDQEIRNLKPGYRDSSLRDLSSVKRYFENALDTTVDINVKQDLQILINSISENEETNILNYQLLLPYYNISEMVYGGIRNLLEDRIPAERRISALERLKKYTGMGKGYVPITKLAMDDMEDEWLKNPNRIAPYKNEIEQQLNTSEQFIEEIKELFVKYEIKGFEKPYKKLVDQVKEYNDYIREKILPKARTDFKLPKEMYALNLKKYGVNMPMEELQERAMVSFEEIQTQMQVLSRIIAKKHNYPSDDYRDVIRFLKKEQLDSATILDFYNECIIHIENIIEKENILTLPDREMQIRLATKAESASIPSPFMSPPRLIGNTGEYGEFVLPLKISGEKEGSTEFMDDFTNKAAAWPLTAHEGRPGHELQFTAMVENGVSLARMIFAMNSVNIEGWALYSEEIVQPYLPIEGQFMTLWTRLLRASRAFVDPGLNLGLLTTEEAQRILLEEVVVSEAMARSELERYQYRIPGQATSYYVGYVKMMELRSIVQLKLGTKFDQQKFHDFVLSQGALPPDLLHMAVFENFIPEYMN